MKKILIVIMICISMLSLTAQTVTLTFNGANKNKNYQVVIDGISYYSNSTADANTTGAIGRRKITLANLQPGSHTLAVYRLKTNAGTYNNGTGTATGRAIYSNTVQLRQGYDMFIRVNGNGGVSLTERMRRISTAVTPMSETSFDQLLSNVRSRYYQYQKVSIIRNALNTTGNFFTTAQVRSLLTMVTSESNRLTLAKLAYPKVSDPRDFTSLYDVFNSIASRDNMNAYIADNPNYNTGSSTGTMPGTVTPPVTNMPMADYDFNRFIQNLGAQANDAQRFNVARDAFNTSSSRFTSAQIRQILMTVYGENDRLALAKISYARVYDPNNFSTVYDLIASAEGRNELNKYVVQSGGTGIPVQVNTRVAMDDAAFAQLYREASNHVFPWNRVKDARTFLSNSSYIFSVAQISQFLALAMTENEKLELAKLGWARASDHTNYRQIISSFTSQASRDELATYIQARPY